MEKNPEIETGNYDFGARMYDSRIGRWWAVDPLSKKYPQMSPYCFVANNPIVAIDYDGRDYIVVIDMENRTITIKAAIVVSTSDEWPTGGLNEQEILDRVHAAANYIEEYNNAGMVFDTDTDLQLDVKFDIYVLTQGEYENGGKEKIDNEYGGYVNQAILTRSSDELQQWGAKDGASDLRSYDKFHIAPLAEGEVDPWIKDIEKATPIYGILNILGSFRNDYDLSNFDGENQEFTKGSTNIAIRAADVDFILHQTKDSEIDIDEDRSNMQRFKHITIPKSDVYTPSQPLNNSVKGGEKKIKGSVTHKRA